MFSDPPAWESPSSDPKDTTFGDVVEGTSLKRAGEYDAVMVGEPYDGAVLGRPGAREGPGAIRQSLAGVKTHHFEHGPVARAGSDDDHSGLSVADLGTPAVLEPAPDSVTETQQGLESVTQHIYETGARPVFLGGDNSLTVPNVAPLLEKSGTVGVISFDAHLDCRTPIDGPSSGTPYTQLHDRGLDKLAVIGARHFETSSQYAGYLEDHGGVIVTAETLRRQPKETAKHVIESMAGIDTLYLSLDIDVLDATAAPGVSAPTPGGPSSAALFRALREVAMDERIAGFEVVECAPPLDQAGRTVDAAARAIGHTLAGWSS